MIYAGMSQLFCFHNFWKKSCHCCTEYISAGYTVLVLWMYLTAGYLKLSASVKHIALFLILILILRAPLENSASALNRTTIIVLFYFFIKVSISSWHLWVVSTEGTAKLVGGHGGPVYMPIYTATGKSALPALGLTTQNINKILIVIYTII